MIVDYEGEPPTLPPFKSWNRYIQIAFLGLMIGAGAFGAYATVVGVMNMTEKPLMVSDDRIDTIYPISAEQAFHRNSLKTELFIYNSEPWNVENVWIGSDIEYDAYKNNQLVSSTQHSFKGPFASKVDFIYKMPIKTYLAKEDPLANIFEDKRIMVMVVDGVETQYSIVTIGEKENAKITITEIK